MNKDRIIQQGDTAKFQVTIQHEDFDQQTDPFRVVVHGGIPDTPVTIDRADMLRDEDGNFFMQVPTAGLVGPLKAYCHYTVPDSDMDSGQREEIDIQMLAFVTDTPCPHIPCCGQCAEDDAHVAYERVWTGSTGGDAYLVDENGQPILDSEGEKIHLIPTHASGSEKVRLNMTGEEFKTLIEGRTDNNVTDTVPELIEQAATAVNPDQLDWISRQMRADLEEEAQKKFAVTTTPDGNSSYYADEVSSKQMTVKVYTTFGGDPVDCGQVGDWQHTAGTNEYTKVITASGGSGATCAAQTFTYTVPSGGYAGITVTGESEKRTISAVKPFYYGWGTTNDPEQAYKVIKTLTRSNSSTGGDTFNTTPAEKSWFWIIVPTGRTSTAEQLGNGIMEDPVSASFTSPKNGNITLACKVYISSRSFVGVPNDIIWSVL